MEGTKARRDTSGKERIEEESAGSEIEVLEPSVSHSMPLQSGTIPSPKLSLNTWNQSKNEQYTSSTVSPAVCHILTFYSWPI